MEIRQNLGFIWMASPVMFAFVFVYVFGIAYILLAFPVAFGVTVALLFYQLVVKQWIVLHWKLAVVHCEPTPEGMVTPRNYKPWPIVFQFWYRGRPREVTDPDTGETVAYLTLGLRGIGHPRYNRRGERVKVLVFHYHGSWEDHVLEYPIETRTGFMGVVVDVSSAIWLHVREMTVDILPDPSGLTDEERLFMVPALIDDVDTGSRVWSPHFRLLDGDKDGIVAALTETKKQLRAHGRSVAAK